MGNLRQATSKDDQGVRVREGARMEKPGVGMVGGVRGTLAFFAVNCKESI